MIFRFSLSSAMVAKEFAFVGRLLKQSLGRTGLLVVAFLAFVAAAKKVAMTGWRGKWCWGKGGGRGEW